MKEIIYEYRINDGMEIIKNIYDAEVMEQSDGSFCYIIYRGKYKERKNVSILDVVERNIVFSLKDDFDKYSNMIIESYKERNDILEQQLNDRKNIYKNLLQKYRCLK